MYVTTYMYVIHIVTITKTLFPRIFITSVHSKKVKDRFTFSCHCKTIFSTDFFFADVKNSASSEFKKIYIAAQISYIVSIRTISFQVAACDKFRIK